MSTSTPWHTQSPQSVITALQSTPQGLDSATAAQRQKQFGPNRLRERGSKSPLRILQEQFTNPMVLLLIGAALISLLLGKYIDSGAVMAIVILNAILGFVQEYRAESAMAALKRLSSPIVRVMRNGTLQELPSDQLVPGDIIQVEAGNTIPADARLLEAANLRVQEAALTGESQPVEKDPTPLPVPSLPIADRHNMLFMGTAVTYGRATAIVTATGMNTELGRIAELIQTVKSEPTPLQRRIGQLGRSLALAVLIIVIISFGIGLLRGEDPILMFQTSISMAVAAVPEGMPTVVTIVLALGAQRMLRRKALIRKLPAVETLGSVTVICSDKTGTLTENRMTVTVLDVAGHTLNLEETLQNGHPTLPPNTPPIVSKWDSHSLLLTGGALCNDATLQCLPEDCGEIRVLGDPTEGALVIAAQRLGLNKDLLQSHYPRLAEVPFSSERRRMSTLHHLATQDEMPNIPAQTLFAQFPYILFVKGGVDSLLEVSSAVWEDGQIHPLDSVWRERIETANQSLAQQGLRVLGIAFRPFQKMPETPLNESIEHDLILIGMVGIIDPPRAEVKQAVQTCQQAGIRPVMITGDQPLTALQIARMLNIVKDSNARVVTGQELNNLSASELQNLVGEVSVYARVSPEHKLRIVEALQKNGEIAAMTGDGVNDAPALRKSDIGVAMGITGTDVSKEAASMVILDDNFATIVNAVEEGRRVYENVRKFIRYTLGSNAGEILVVFLAPLIGMPLPLTPLMILWMNLVTDGLPGLALATEAAEPDTMHRPPVHPNENIFGRGVGSYIFRIGIVMGIAALAFGYFTWQSGNPNWDTMLFTLLILMQAGHALAIRSDRLSIFQQSIRSNPAIFGAVLLTIVLQLAAIYWPPLQKLFGTTPLSINEFLLTLAASATVFAWVEIEKWLRRRKEN